MLMFKSVFTKYVITFMTLLLVSFLLLLFIVNSVFTGYSLRAERRHVTAVAVACSAQLAELYSESDATDFGEFVLADILESSSSEIRRLLSAILTNSDDMTVYVTDNGGGFIFSTGKFPDMYPSDGAPLLSDEDLAALLGEEETVTPTSSHWLESDTKDTADTDAGGVFLDSELFLTNGQTLSYAIPVGLAESSPVGYVIVTSTTESQSTMVAYTLRSMLVAGLWIMLAALIAIYFITERVIGPLRDMSKATKKMAVGQFDVRVPVRGRDEVAELAVAFNQMADALENLERMRNSFVANVSHDLRTPMTTIAGFIDGILDGVIPKEQTEHYLRVVTDEVRRLSRLVTALLDVSRLQAGDRKFDMKPFDVCEMGRQILISFEKKIDEKGLDVEFSCDDDYMFVLADRDAIHQILYNICDNAVKFASVGGKLKMSFTYESDSRNHRKTLVTVYNEGQGIPPEDLPFVFERFYKSDKSRSLDKTGVGLGMFIAKTIIEAHGETISAASDYGHSCTFTFTLARTEPPAQKSRAGHVQGGNP